MRVAVPRHRDPRKHDDINVKVWGALAEQLAIHMHPGRHVRVTGALRQDEWLTGQDGKPAHRERLYLSASIVEFISPPATDRRRRPRRTNRPTTTAPDAAHPQLPLTTRAA